MQSACLININFLKSIFFIVRRLQTRLLFVSEYTNRHPAYNFHITALYLQFFCCKKVLTLIAKSPILDDNTSHHNGRQVMASLASITSHYIQAQSEYIPLMDARSCLYHLNNSPSPICVNTSMSKQCSHGCSDNKSRRHIVWLSELELSLESVNLFRGVMQRAAGKDESLLMTDSSFQSIDNVCEVLSGLHRIAELYCARESIKEATHYAMEGLELAKLSSFRYW